MKLNRSMPNVMNAARSIEMRATVRSDTIILKAYKAFQKICDVEKKYSTSMLDYSNALVNANNALIEIEEAIESVGHHGKKYFEDEFIQNSADILDRSCPDITGQINAMYNNIVALEQLNTIYLSAQAVKDRILLYASSDPNKEKEDANSSVKDDKADHMNEYVDKLKNESAALKHRGGRRRTEINE